MPDETFIKDDSAIKKTTSSTQPLPGDKSPFFPLIQSLGSAVGFDFVLFDSTFDVQYASASQSLDLTGQIDLALAKSIASKMDWKAAIEKVLQMGDITQWQAVRSLKNRIFDLTCIPLRTNNNNIISGGAIIFQDVTEKIGRENELSHSERLITMGKVAGKVAHELNNPMDGILRYLNLAMRILEQGDIDKAQEYLRQSRAGLMRMVHILSELLEFSRSSAQAMEPAPLDKVIQDALAATAAALDGIDVRIQRKFEGQPLQVRNDSLFQVFCNLIKNACDAMQGNGRLTITIERIEMDWQISFLDSGPGIPVELRSAIFQPFFTTKTAGNGVGLGLAICKDLIEKARGSISVQCPDEGGSLFIVRLPASAGIAITPRIR